VTKMEITVQELTVGWLVTVENQKRNSRFACETREEVYVLVKRFMEEGS